MEIKNFTLTVSRNPKHFMTITSLRFFIAVIVMKCFGFITSLRFFIAVSKQGCIICEKSLYCVKGRNKIHFYEGD